MKENELIVSQREHCYRVYGYGCEKDRPDEK